MTSIENYVIEKRGYDRDSPEGLAARFIEHEGFLGELKPRDDYRLKSAFKLGEVWALSRVYAVLDKQQRAPRNKKKAWATELARALVRESPNTSANTLIDELPDRYSPREHRNGEVFREEEQVVFAHGDTIVDEIARRTFRRYIEAAQAEKKAHAPKGLWPDNR